MDKDKTVTTPHTLRTIAGLNFAVPESFKHFVIQHNEITVFLNILPN